MNKSNQWFLDEDYSEQYVTSALAPFAGPQGIATVAVYASGKSQPGWGEQDFMRNYHLGKFNAAAKHDEFAYVMRSMKLLVIDIDGKNDGIEKAKLLNLPPTMAETSKSGNGYHLWYHLPDNWDQELGFARLSDRLALVQGVDVRVTGCVFHYPQQRWNHRAPELAPEHLINQIEVRAAVNTTPAQIKQLLADDDDIEIKRLINDALESLKKAIPPGRRNQTLFAIGSQLYLLGYAAWFDVIREKADDVGLDDVEREKIIANIPNYADRA